jgi:hypothetical protein
VIRATAAGVVVGSGVLLSDAEAQGFPRRHGAGRGDIRILQPGVGRTPGRYVRARADEV